MRAAAAPPRKAERRLAFRVSRRHAAAETEAMMAVAAAGAGAAVARSRRRVIDSFKEQGAFAPQSAITFHPLRAIDERMFGRLLNKGVILPADNRRFYLDAHALMESDKSRGRVKAVALTGVGALALATIAAVLFG